MTAHESTNAHGDAHAAALARSRKRATLRAWDAAVAAWREWQPDGDDGNTSDKPAEGPGGEG